jgi:hypothetical protein
VGEYLMELTKNNVGVGFVEDLEQENRQRQMLMSEREKESNKT